jgi:hypothetical protein
VSAGRLDRWLVGGEIPLELGAVCDDEAAERVVDRDHVAVRRGVPRVDLPDLRMAFAQQTKHLDLEPKAEAVSAVLSHDGGVLLEAEMGPLVLDHDSGEAGRFSCLTVPGDEAGVSHLAVGEGSLVIAIPRFGPDVVFDREVVDRRVVHRALQIEHAVEQVVGNRLWDLDDLVRLRGGGRFGEHLVKALPVEFGRKEPTLRRIGRNREATV